MSDTAAEPQDTAAKSSKLPLFAGIALALVGGAGGYFAMTSGMWPFGESPDAVKPMDKTEMPAEFAYVALDPLVVSLSSDGQARLLRFAAQLEVGLGHEAEVDLLKPRIIDMLNGYLRAVTVTDLEDSFALARMRSQILRRVQVVVGDGRVRDVLITEFVLN